VKIIVTGSAGFIGKRLCQIFKRKHDVFGIDIKTNVDIRNTKSIYTVMKDFKPDVVIHLAAQTKLRYSIKQPIFDAETNIIGSLNILEACRKCGVERIIYASTGGARYGNSNFCHEYEKLHPVSPYGVSKHTVEHYLETYQHMYKIWPTTLCFGNVYGPGDDPSSERIITSLITKAIANKRITIFGDGNQTRDFIYIDDVIRAIQTTLKLNPIRRRKIAEHEIFNIGTETQTSINNIITLLSDVFTLKVKYNQTVVGELNSTPLCCTKAKEILKWTPKWNLERGIKKTIEWYLKLKELKK